jgi:hypothetical protein
LHRWYAPDEILLHELAHVGRVAFEESQFEEILAYRLSPSTFRQSAGPLCHRLTKAPLLLATAVGIGSVFAPLPTLFTAFIGIGALWGSCQSNMRILSRCESALAGITSPMVARYILYRLTDAEICAFSQLTGDHLIAVIKKKFDSELRWRVIEKAYLRDYLPRPVASFISSIS